MLYETELIRNRGPWRGLDDVEFATLERVDWFNRRSLFEAHDQIPPAEFEANHYRRSRSDQQLETQTPCMKPGAVLGEVDLVPGEGLEFAEAEAGVEGGGPERAFAER
jgi:hypothetical protein